jgi:hypothetical protein
LLGCSQVAEVSEMSSIVVRFPDGSKKFRFPEKELEEGDTIWHEGARYRVVSVSSDGAGRPVAVVEPESSSLGDLIQSEEGAIRLVPLAG